MNMIESGLPFIPLTDEEVTARDALTALAKKLEAFETDQWCVDAILAKELMTGLVWDPCVGTGILADAAEARGYTVLATDIHDWGRNRWYGDDIKTTFDFLSDTHADWYVPGDGDLTVFMNPPFKHAVDFVKRAHKLGARKIICFQRLSWYEGELHRGKKRGQFWKDFPPNRIYICGSRATCWRFDVPEEVRKESGNTPTAHAWFVWEEGQPAGTLTGHVYDKRKDPC